MSYDFSSIYGADPYRVGDAASFDGASGLRICATSPQALADSAGVSLDIYAVARMCASEGYAGAGPAVWLALAEAARNKAQQRGVSPSQLLLRCSRTASADGLFSQQAVGKWASTYEDPTAQHIEAARMALEDGTQFALGATDFFDPTTQDSGKQGSVTLTTTSQQYIANNAAQGLYWVGKLEGVNEKKLMLFNGVGPQSTDDASDSGGSDNAASDADAALADNSQLYTTVALVGIGAFALLSQPGALAAARSELNRILRNTNALLSKLLGTALGSVTA